VTPDLWFQIANPLALAGWLVLLASQLSPKWSNRIAGYVIPLVLSVGYAALILAFWSRAGGGFDSLANVERLFETRELLLAGWVHYLAFDLFIGAWQVRIARAEGMRFVLVIPCLVLTFLFGPIGLLLFLALRFALGARKTETAVA
jgi:hypothetical protein